MRFVVRRLGFFVVTLWAAVTVNFLIPRLMPGNAAIAMMARYHGRINPEALHALEVAFGVNTHQSLVGAYFTYLGNIVRGRFGTSLTFFPDAVSHEVLQALPWTLALVGVTTILAFVLGTLIGLVAGWRRGGMLDGFLPPIFVVTSAFPYFWLALLSIWLFFTRTRAGIIVRAAVQDAEMLDGLGVNVPRVFTLTFAGSAALAALAGLLLAPVFTVYPAMGVEMILLAFIVVILGGMGSLGGSVLAAFVIGIAQSLLTLWMNPQRVAIAIFGIMLLVLIVRPRGFFGREGVLE